jgi:Proto-chlorophyllide reductase 57 kD subunit.
MGLEEHLLTMFREDFEFHDDAGASHHGHKAKLREMGISDTSKSETVPAEPVQKTTGPVEIVWLPAAEKELKKIPFFVRGKAKRNTETFASERGVQEISVDTLYEAKAHYAR